MKFKYVVVLASLGLPICSMATDLGTVGNVYPVKEISLLDAIKKRVGEMVDSGEWEKIKQDNTKKIVEGIRHPKGNDLPLVTKPRTFTLDPSITVTADITDTQGNIIAKKGSVVNPLVTGQLSKAVLFIDGTVDKQLAWAMAVKKDAPLTVVIFTKGSWMEAMEKYHLQIFYDQNGQLIQKFGIEHVPSKVTQQGEVLKIEEVLL